MNVWESCASYAVDRMKRLPHIFLQSTSVPEKETWDVRIAATTVKQPETAMWVNVQANPPHLNGDIVYEASRISRPDCEVAAPRTMNKSADGCFSTLMMNLRRTPAKLKQGDRVGKSFLFPSSELLTATVDQTRPPAQASNQSHQVPWDVFNFGPSLDEYQVDSLKKLIAAYRTCVAPLLPTNLDARILLNTGLTQVSMLQFTRPYVD